MTERQMELLRLLEQQRMILDRAMDICSKIEDEIKKAKEVLPHAA